MWIINDSPIGSFQIVIGKLDPFNNDSCEPRSELERDNIFQRYDMSYSDLVRRLLLNKALPSKQHKRQSSAESRPGEDNKFQFPYS